MNKVTVQEVVDLLKEMLESDSLMGRITDGQVIDGLRMLESIQQHGIEVAYTPMTLPTKDIEDAISMFVEGVLGDNEFIETVEQAVLARLGVAPPVAYTRMTDDEILAIYSKWFVAEYGYEPHTISSVAWESAFEQAVLARLGVAPVIKDSLTTEYREALQIATFLWRNHYAEISPNWKALPDLSGVLSQISDMVSGVPFLNSDQAKQICEQAGFAVVKQEDFVKTLHTHLNVALKTLEAAKDKP